MTPIQLSHWAAAHPRQARTLLAIAHTVVIFGAFKIGKWLYFLEFGYLYWPVPVFSALFFLLYMTYPKSGAATYWRRKSYDLLLPVLSSVVIVFGYNNFLSGDTTGLAGAPQAQFVNRDQPAVLTPSAEGGEAFALKKQVRQARQQIRQAAKRAKQHWKQRQAETSVGLKIFFTFLAAAAMFIAFLVIALMSCSLSCSGQEGAAAVVLILGIIGIAVGGFFLIRGIWRRP